MPGGTAPLLLKADRPMLNSQVFGPSSPLNTEAILKSL